MTRGSLLRRVVGAAVAAVAAPFVDREAFASGFAQAESSVFEHWARHMSVPVPVRLDPTLTQLSGERIARAARHINEGMRKERAA